MKTPKFAGMIWHEVYKTGSMPALMPAIENIWHEKIGLYVLQTAILGTPCHHATHARCFLKKSGLLGRFLAIGGGYSALLAWAEYPPPERNNQWQTVY